MNVYGSGELKADVLLKDLCIGCGACISLCPYFKSYNGKTAMLFPCTQPQGRCFAYCPKVEVDLDGVSKTVFGTEYKADPIGQYRSVKTAKAGGKVKGGNFQCGGTVSALITYALEKKKIDAAVLTDREGVLPVPRLVTDPAEVLKCASSKYTAAPTLSALNVAVDQGYRRLGVVATPCQVLALAQMRGNPTGVKDFADPTALIVGLFCTWSLDYRELKAFLEEKVDLDAVKKFDIPPPPAEVMEVHTVEGKVRIPLDEVRKRVPNSCTYCFDMTSEFADVSVGVLEGRADMNTLIVRTARGEEMVEGAVKEGYLAVQEMPKANLEHLMTAAGNKKKRALKKANDEGMINAAGDGARSYLRVQDGTARGFTA